MDEKLLLSLRSLAKAGRDLVRGAKHPPLDLVGTFEGTPKYVDDGQLASWRARVNSLIGALNLRNDTYPAAIRDALSDPKSQSVQSAADLLDALAEDIDRELCNPDSDSDVTPKPTRNRQHSLSLVIGLKTESRNRFDWPGLASTWQKRYGGQFSAPKAASSGLLLEWADVDGGIVLEAAELGHLDNDTIDVGGESVMEIVQDRECLYQHVPEVTLSERSPTEHVDSVEMRTIAGGVDVVLVTVTEIERDTVLSAMRAWPGRGKMLLGAITTTTYRFGQFGRYLAAHVESTMGDVGRDAATLTVRKAIAELKPKAVLLLGIAFGVSRKKQRLGDIIVAESVFPYDVQRVGANNTIHRGTEMQCGRNLSERFRTRRSEWFLECGARPVKVHQGQLLSGPKLIDNREFRDNLIQEFPNALGGEMEGAGAYAAAADAGVEVILVKGICDWADGHKNDHAQLFAAWAAVCLAEHVLGQKGVLDAINARDRGLPPIEKKLPQVDTQLDASSKLLAELEAVSQVRDVEKWLRIADELTELWYYSDRPSVAKLWTKQAMAFSQTLALSSPSASMGVEVVALWRLVPIAEWAGHSGSDLLERALGLGLQRAGAKDTVSRERIFTLPRLLRILLPQPLHLQAVRLKLYNAEGELYEKTIMLLGEKDPSILMYLANLVRLRQIEGEVDKVHLVMDRSLTIAEKRSKEWDVNSLALLTEVAIWLDNFPSNGHVERCIAILKRVKSSFARRKAGSEELPVVLFSLGSAYRSVKQYRLARNTLVRALELADRAEVKRNQLHVEILLELGYTLRDLDDNDGSQRMCEEARKTFHESHLGPQCDYILRKIEGQILLQKMLQR